MMNVFSNYYDKYRQNPKAIMSSSHIYGNNNCLDSYCKYDHIPPLSLSCKACKYLQISFLLSLFMPLIIQSYSTSSSSSQSIPIETIAHQFVNNNNKQTLQNIASESTQLSTRTIQTKYGQIRGNLVKLSAKNIFKNQHRTSSSPSSSSSYSQMSSSSNNNNNNNVDWSDVETYLGVPYATPPTGGLRFMPPVTPTHWRGIRLVTRLRPVCPQLISKRDYQVVRTKNETEALRFMTRIRYEYLRRLIPMLSNQSEDCLYLNIYVPTKHNSNINNHNNNNNRQTSADSQSFPVLVILHGESYDWHSGNVFDGTILASYGQIIVITVNFRLGILGFLPAFTDGTIRGNYGLMDQVAALHWIQENIAEFGGQPSNVTLLGHGHGAAFVHLLMLSPMAKGLFNRVILMSGSALSPWAITRDPENYVRKFGDKLNCTDLDTMIDCLRGKKINQLIAQYENISPEHLTAFGPIIDSIVVPFDPIHIYHYHDYNDDKLYHLSSPSSSSSSSERAKNDRQHFDPLLLAKSYDLMIGYTDVDSSTSSCLFSEQESLYGVEPERRDRILRTLVRNLYDYHQQAIFLILYNEYSSWNAATTSSSKMNNKRSFDTLDSVKSILNDALVFAPLIRLADSHSSRPSSSSQQYNDGRLFFYYFNTNQVSQESLYDVNRITTSFHSSSSFNDYLSPSKRILCSIGHDLAYLFGDPIAHLQFGYNTQVGPFYYPVNLTQTHQIVSELFMQYVINFVYNGDPNTRSTQFPAITNRHQLQQQSSKINNKNNFVQRYFWPKYDLEQRNYLSLGSTSPKPMDYRQNHRLSLWLNLIPRLLIDDHDFYQTNFGANLTNKSNDSTNQRDKSRFTYYSRNYPNQYYNFNSSLRNYERVIGETSKHVAGSMAMASEPYSSQQQQEKQLYRQHHLLVDYDNPKSYDGIVRTFSNNTIISNHINGTNAKNDSIISPNHNNTLTSLNNSIAILNFSLPSSSINHNWHNVTNHPTNFSDDGNRLLIGHPMYYGPIADNSTSSWLIIIGVACALLFFINVIFFIALFHQLRKNRKVQQNQKSNNNDDKSTEMISNIQSRCDQSSPNYGNKCSNRYRDQIVNDHQNIDDNNLMILHTSNNNTLNREKSSSNGPVFSMYSNNTTNDRAHIDFDLSQSDVVMTTSAAAAPASIVENNSANTIVKHAKTLSFATHQQSTSDLNDRHHQTILLNHNTNEFLNRTNDTIATGNYVPFLTSTAADSTNHHSQPSTTYYCLQVNPTATPATTTTTNQSNDQSLINDGDDDNGETNSFKLQTQQQQRSSIMATNLGYHDMAL